VKSENIAHVDSIGHGRTYTSAAERWAEQRRLVVLVIAAYRAVQTLEPVIAFNPDPESRSRTNRWSPDSAHYKVDVENTIRRVIEAKPESERQALWAAWTNLLTDDDGKIGKDEQRLVRLLSGPAYTKKLHPGMYFRPRVR
jgi:hypothetical protein